MAWLFDVATDKVLIPSGWTGSAATILMWIKRSGTPSGGVITTTHGNNPWRAWSNAAGGGSTVAGLDAQGSSRNTLVSFDSAFSNITGGAMGDGAWHCIALVMNGTAWALHYGTDAAALTKVTGTKANATTPGSWTLSDAAPDFFDGTIASVKLFGAALSDAEVAAELQTYAQVRSSNLLFRATLSTSSNTPETGTTMTAGSTAVTVVAGPTALDGVTGAMAGTVRSGFLSGALAGTVTDQGALAGTAPHPVTGNLIGSNRGALAGTLTQAQGALVGKVVDLGGLAGTMSPPAGAITGKVIDAGALAASPPRVVSTLAGTHPSVGTLAATLRLPVSTLRQGDRFPPGAWRTGTPVPAAGWGTSSEDLAMAADWRAGEPTEAA
jgi:hypothetical protein